MTITVNIGDADLNELLARVEAGEEVILARDGSPVATMTAIAGTSTFEIVPTEEERAKRRALIDQIIAERATRQSATAEEIDEWKKEGRR